MFGKQLTVVAAAAALGVAGCGGDDSNKTLSYSDYGKKLDEVCATQNPKIKPLGEKLNGDPANDAEVYGEVIPLLEETRDKVKDLNPPDELKADADKLESVADQQVTLAKQAETQAKAGDKNAYLATVKQLQSLSDEGDAAASKLGAGVCLED